MQSTPYQKRGHIGGTVWSNNFNGAFIRTRRKPIFHRTPRQTQARANFRNVVQFWRTLSAPEKQSWIDQLGNYTRTHTNGEPYEIYGFILSNAFNLPTVTAEEPPINSGTDPVSFPSISFDFFIIDLNPFGLGFGVTPGTIPTGFTYKIFASVLMDIPRSLSYPNDFKLIQEFETSPGAVYNISSAYVAAYGPGPNFLSNPDDSFFVEIRLILRHIATGQQTEAAAGVAEFFIP